VSLCNIVGSKKINKAFSCYDSACVDSFLGFNVFKWAPSEAAAVAQVNGRLEKQEEEGKDGDPAFPKQQWPPSKLCPLCHLPNSQVRLHTCTISQGTIHTQQHLLSVEGMDS